MKVVVLVPSADSLATAGVRIRYLRLREALAASGVSLSVTPIDSFDARKAECDVAIVSKCYDARALVAAAVLSRRSVRVGIDLFDDYFSEAEDSRLSRYRTWLRQMLRLSHFALCSTPTMAQVTARYDGETPVHILNDPAPEIDREALGQLLEAKIARSRSSGVLRVSWFGIGDNPSFPVGISDVASFREALADLASQGPPIELTILTNKRALDAGGLAMIAQLPFPATIDIWSAQRESALLKETDVCFLPVNAQPFSISKSMNRALTALAAGCQVLSVGYPLYEPLGELIYRTASDLVADWRGGEPRLRPTSLPALEAKIAQLASPEREAAALAGFLQRIFGTQAAPPTAGGPIVLLHGFATNQSAHAAVQAAGGLSIATPFCPQELDFDGIVKLAPGRKISLLVSVDAMPKLNAPSRRRNAPVERIGSRKFVEVPAPSENAGNGNGAPARPLPLQLALYSPLIEDVSALLSNSFGAATVLLSEESTLPVEPAI